LDLKKSYREDLQLFKNKSSGIAFLVMILALVAFPFVSLRISGGAYYINVLNLIAINAIVAVGLNILVGYTGQVSLGHAGFYAIGAYAQAMLVLKMGLPMIIALPLAGLIAAVFGFLLGLPALRLEGPYLAIATLGFGMAVTQIIGRLDFLGGRMGLEVPGPEFTAWLKTMIAEHISPERATDAPHYAIYLIAIPLAVLLSIAAVNLMKSRIGRAFVAIRDSDISAEALGVNLTMYKTSAFAISAFFTGVAGGLYTHAMGFINPESFDLRLSITFLAIVVVGGLGSILGSHLGAILMTILPLSLTAVRDVPEIIYGAIMILVILFEPLGLRGRWLKIKQYWKAWPF
jgi:branched-chain amino acid transport system permease protein